MGVCNARLMSFQWTVADVSQGEKSVVWALVLYHPITPR